MSVSMQFVGPYSDKANRYFDCGEKWVRDIVAVHTTVCIEPQGGYIDPAGVQEIARQLKKTVKVEDEDVRKVRTVFTEAGKKGLGLMVDW